MEQVCHRCGTALNGSDPFCPHCAAPQLRYEAAEESAPFADTTPAQRLTARHLDGISWRDAILAAALIALPAGLLSSLIGFEALWVIGGGMAVIALYRRRTGSLPSSGMGWRIGGVLGLFSAVVAATIDGVRLLMQRYVFHQGAILDQQFRDAIEMNAKTVGALFAGSNANMASALADSQRFWLSPEGAAAMVLGNTAGLLVSMLLFAAAGGALGARLTHRAAQPSAR